MTKPEKSVLHVSTFVRDREVQPRVLSEDHLLTEAEVARRQGRSVKTLQNQRVTGGGIPFLKLGRCVRYRLSDVLAWEEAARRLSTSNAGGAK